MRLVAFLLSLALLFFCQPTVVLQYSTGGELSQYERDNLKLFEERYPHIKIRPVKLPVFSMSQHDSYVTYLSAGEGSVDVFAIDVIWLAEFAQSGFIAPLDAYFNTKEREIYLPRLLSAGIYQEKLYGIPGVADIGLLYVNQKLLEKKKIKIKQKASWEFYLGLKLKDIYPLALQAGPSESLICNLLEFFPAEVELLDDLGQSLQQQKKEWLFALKWLQKAVEVSHKRALNHSEKESSADFLAQKSLFLRNWPYFLGELRQAGMKINEDFLLLPLPEKPTIGGWYLVVNENSPHKEEAALFLKFMTGQEIQMRNFTQRYARGEPVGLPSLSEIYENKELQKEFPELIAVQQSLEKARARFITPRYYEYSRILLRQIRSFLMGKEKAEIILDKLKDEIEKRSYSSWENL
ncbi:MAG: extracellular solute-binding protein [Leptospiraceae bacterium]|nr:extracellular solute-binding protein [Leptospiraceae bacterium]MDW8306003.1 extracellular solute-binding protein [Leptospiraceae bacterium]